MKFKAENINILTRITLAIAILLPVASHARLEYALEHRITSCTGCHASPFGGGPKNVDGKMYASRFDEPSPWSKQEMVSLDVRAISYYPKSGTASRQGTALMATSAFVDVPIKTDSTGRELRFVGGYNFGMNVPGARDIYGQWRSGPKVDNPAYIQIGRINVPFGILTDEHRTFTRLLTRTGIFDYEFGASFSKNWGDGIHYDLAVTNGGRSGGAFVDNSSVTPDATTGYIANVRWMPSFLPLLVGASGEYEDRLTPNPTPNSIGGYFALSLDRLTHNRFLGSVIGEAVSARHFSDVGNPNIARYFIPGAGDAGFVSQISNETAFAWYTQVNWNFAPRWVGQYRFERIVFDQNYSGDRFVRHEYSLKYFADSNISLLARYELADVGRAEIKGTNTPMAEDAFWLMAQLWL